MEILHPRCAGLDVHKDTVVACVRLVTDGKVIQDVKTFATVTKELLALSDFLSEHAVTHVVMESTGVYWKPVWHVLDGSFELVLANAQHVRNVPALSHQVAEDRSDLEIRVLQRLLNPQDSLGFFRPKKFRLLPLWRPWRLTLC